MCIGEELLKQDQVSGGSSEDADKVKPFRSLAMKQRQLNPTSAKQQVTYYDAVLIATDSDFLESRRCRQFFHENAVFEDDAVLMEMKAVTQQDLDNQQNALRSPERHWWTVELDDDIRKWSWMTWLKIILVNLVVTSSTCIVV